ncbi:hypothetical protein [Nocardioides sp.]|uniref:hypothetical protein n=1 Tax=Nocardioides sp. TaxID=35761 RepID=UPI0031FF2531|nr:hypothetical protein [Nocardioides sp.]
MKPNLQSVLDALSARGVPSACPRCGTGDAWTAADGIVYVEVTGGHNVRSAALVCGHCGHVALHALAVLGLDD